LSGNGEAPEEWIISTICEEFHCLPNEAIKAIQEDEGFTLFKILDYRAYARAKEIYDRTPMEKRPKNALMSMVSDIEFGLAKEKIEKFKQENG